MTSQQAPPDRPTQFPVRSTSLRDLNLLCWGALLTCFVIPFSIVILQSHAPPNGDFAGFYSWGRIIHEYPSGDFYNYPLLQKMCYSVQPRDAGYGPLPYPPYAGLVFVPFAWLPYWAAYLLWSLISIGLYLAGLWMILSRFLRVHAHARSLLIGLAFCFAPFLVDTAANGQLAAVGFLAFAAAVREDDLGHAFRSGLAISVCSYKPTLLVLALPMLLLTRRWRALAGFAVGTAAMSAAATALAGRDVWRGFISTLLSFGHASVKAKSATILILAKYVDLTSFAHAVPGGQSLPVLLAVVAVGGAALAALVRMWWVSTRLDREFQPLMWAATLTWTLVLNIYVPVYDTILVVLAVLLMAESVRRIDDRPLKLWFHWNWALLLACSWFAVTLAAHTGVQVLTLLLISLGLLQLRLLWELKRFPNKAGAASMYIAHGMH